MVLKILDQNLSVILNIRVAGLPDLSIIVFALFTREVATVGHIRNMLLYANELQLHNRWAQLHQTSRIYQAQQT